MNWAKDKYNLKENKQTKPVTHFGYKEIPVEEKVKKVSEVFHSVASHYDLMNDLMSLGLHRLWKDVAICFSHVRPGHTLLDLAGGTGDLCYRFAKKMGPHGKIILSDINEAMLTVGRQRLIDKGLINVIQYVQANAESLPFENHSFHCVSMGFGLRNVTHKDKALAEIARVLKPGGQAIILEFSTPVLPFIKPLYDAYSFSVLPRLGKWVTGDGESYRYLAESIRMHPDQTSLKQMMLLAGFEEVKYHNLAAGIVAIHRGFKYS